jgi:hypothetical protein
VPLDDYRRALEAAIKEYEALGAERHRIDTRLSELAQTIGTLTRLCGLTPTVPWGLTDACRTVLRNAGAPMSPSEVRDRLQGIGYDLSSYSNALAAIHTTLKRLAEAEELRTTAPLPGRKFRYLWQRPPKSGTHVLLNAEINREIAQAQKPWKGKK